MNLEQLISLRKAKGFITIDSFNNELLEELKNQDVFTISEYKGKSNDTFDIMMNFVNQSYDLTEKQKKLYNYILMSQIMPYLDDVIAGKKEVVGSQPIKVNAAVDKTYLHCSTCECKPTDAPNITPTFDVNDIKSEDLPF